jgi:hypothetical protein
MDNRSRSLDKKRIKFVTRKLEAAEADIRMMGRHGIGNGDSTFMLAERKARVLRNELKSLTFSGAPANNMAEWEG